MSLVSALGCLQPGAASGGVLGAQAAAQPRGVPAGFGGARLLVRGMCMVGVLFLGWGCLLFM